MALRAWLMLALTLSASFAPGASATHGGTVRVTSDTGFTAAHWDGDGTEDDPYTPRFTTIVASGGYGVELSGTEAHVNITGLTITGGSTVSDAIRLYDVRNVTVYGNTLETNRYGVHVRSSSDVTVAANTVKTSQVGVFLESSSDVAVEDNRLSLNERDVEIKLSAGNVLARNNLSVATGQYGFFFDDNTSYANDIDTTNVVNAIPVRWYTDLHGTADDPIVIEDVTVDLPRMTNVAQIMLHDSSYVRLERPTAKAGAANGIHLHRTADVEIVEPTTDGNGASGVLLELANDTTITDAASRNNTLHGLLAQSTRATSVDGLTATGNRGQGVRVVASARDTSLSSLILTSNALGGIVVDRSTGFALASSTLTSNGATAVSLETVGGVELSDNVIGGTGTTAVLVARSSGTFDATTITGHTTGFSFVAATGSNLTANEVTLSRGGTGFAFDGAVSYDNELSTTNLVNDTPVRWYTRLTGPLTLDALEVEQRGITNVAQIMLYRTRNVTLSNALATNGSAAGVALYLANDTTIDAASVSGNAAQGVLATQSLRLDLHASTIEGNTGDGVKLASSPLALVENTVISDGAARGITAELSSAPTLRGNAITGHVGAGIYLDRVGTGAATADHNVLTRNLGGGIMASHAVVGTIASNTLTSNGADGIAIANAPAGARLEDNELANHTRGIRLTKAGGAELSGNVVDLSRANQTGIHVDDEDSYNSTIDTTNLVEGTPVRWYYATSGVEIDAPAVELAGITNVAQIMLYRVDNVTLTAPVAANGTARGIYALRADNLTIVDANASGNARAGIAVESSKQVSVSGGASTENTQEGILVKASGGTVVADATIADNGGAGVSLDAAPSPGAELTGLTIERNVMGIVASASAIGTISGNAIADNGARGISLSASSGGNVTSNEVEEHAHGIHLIRTTGTTFEDNVVTIGIGQTAWWFDDEVSYDSGVGETNLANDVPMRWYARQDGLVLADVTADLAGMTNVAQVMVYRSNESQLTNVTAANGTARGLYVYASNEVDVAESAVIGNAGDGLAMNLSIDLTVDGLEAVGNGGSGARLDNRSTLTGSTFRGNTRGGIVLERAPGAVVSGNDVADEPLVGIALRNVTGGAEVSANTIDNATQGIAFLASEFARVEDNAISKSASQYGLWFSDERSYNNIIGTSNTVEGAPVHWYTTLAGTEADPVVLEDVASELRGITNVAQVMIYRSAYVEAPGVVATNGTARGIYLYRSSAIAIDGANASGNALYGVHLQSTQSSTITGLSAQGSGVGVRLNESHNNVVSGVNATGASPGVGIDALSRDNRIHGITVTGTARGVTDAGWTSGGLLGANVVLDGGATKRAKVGNDLTFNDTMATYRLEASRIVAQAVELGDGSANVTSAAATPLRPTHAYPEAGTYVANLTAETADGITLTDSVLVEIVPPLSAPTSLRATPGGRNITLTWSAPASDGASTITKYRVYRGVNTSTLAYVGESTAAARSYVDLGLENGRTYHYRVAAVNAEGEGPNASATGKPVSTPAAPVGLVGASLPNGSRLTWSPPTDDGGHAIRGYDVLMASGGGGLALLDSIGNVTTFHATGLTNGENYTFAVRARSSEGNGALSANVTVRPLGPPTAPLKLKALAGDASATLVWEAPTDDGASAVTGYRVWRGSSNETLVELPAAIAAGTRRYRDTGLANGATYVYAVAGVNAIGQGARSTSVAVVPEAVDRLVPVVFGRSPDDGAFLAESPATIRAEYADNEGIDLASVRVYLDGTQANASVDESGFALDVGAPLPRGLHTVRVVLSDPQGNEADETWTFRVLSEEEIVPRFVLSGHELVPARVAPGAPVTARVHVRNEGYAPGNLTVELRLGDGLLAYAETTLGIGEATDLALPFDAPTTLGEYDVTLGDAPLLLTVAEGDEAPAPTPEPTPATPTPTGPERDANVTPRELGKETPGPALALALAALAAAVVLRRRKA